MNSSPLASSQPPAMALDMTRLASRRAPWSDLPSLFMFSRSDERSLYAPRSRGEASIVLMMLVDSASMRA